MGQIIPKRNTENINVNGASQIQKERVKSNWHTVNAILTIIDEII
jgi:hypothetical protein